jgi:hypothetical protein
MVTARTTPDKLIETAVQLAVRLNRNACRSIEKVTKLTKESAETGKSYHLQVEVIKGFLSFNEKHPTVSADKITTALGLADRPHLADEYLSALMDGSVTAMNLDPEFAEYVQRAVEDRAEKIIQHISPHTAEVLGMFYANVVIGRAQAEKKDISAEVSKASEFASEVPFHSFARGFLKYAQRRGVPVRSERALTGMILKGDPKLASLAFEEMRKTNSFPEGEMLNVIKNKLASMGVDVSVLEPSLQKKEPEPDDDLMFSFDM